MSVRIAGGGTPAAAGACKARITIGGRVGLYSPGPVVSMYNLPC